MRSPKQAQLFKERTTSFSRTWLGWTPGLWSASCRKQSQAFRVNLQVTTHLYLSVDSPPSLLAPSSLPHAGGLMHTAARVVSVGRRLLHVICVCLCPVPVSVLDVVCHFRSLTCLWSCADLWSCSLFWSSAVQLISTSSAIQVTSSWAQLALSLSLPPSLPPLG